jgi:ArsR family metal-binding transcriptional regulator
MRVKSIEKVLPCIADPWKLRIIAHLDETPDLVLISKYLNGKYSEELGMVALRIGEKELNFFKNSQVTIRMVDSEKEATELVNNMLAVAYHKAMISGDL